MKEVRDLEAPLRIRADWGGANLTRVAGWLAQWVWDQTNSHRRTVIHTGRGQGDNLVALAHGEVDAALITPASFATMAKEGVGPFTGRALSELVAIASFPHRDAMLPVVHRDLGIDSLGDLAEHKGALRLSLGAGDPDGFMGFAGEAVLAAVGLSISELEDREWAVTRHEQPFDVIADLHEGRADVIVAEAIMTPAWQALTAECGRVLSLEVDHVAALTVSHGLSSITVPGNYFPEHPYEIVGLDYSDWTLVCTSDLDNETVALLTRAIVEYSEKLDRAYSHLPVAYSPLRYPLDYRIAKQTPIELHPAAALVYSDASSRDLIGAEAAR